MEFRVKRFNELTTDELYAILKLRCEVFIVEQECPYPDIDGVDDQAVHVMFVDDGAGDGDANGEPGDGKCGEPGDGDVNLAAYLRILPAGLEFEHVSIGRVIAVRRRQGLGTEIVKKGIEVARNELGADTIYLEAQVYAMSMYEKLGFVPVSEEFLLDGIPHIKMELHAYVHYTR